MFCSQVIQQLPSAWVQHLLVPGWTETLLGFIKTLSLPTVTSLPADDFFLSVSRTKILQKSWLFLWPFFCIQILSVHFYVPPHPPIACLEYQKQLLVLFQFFCVPKRGPVESISFLLTYSKGTNRVLVFGIGPIAVSFSSLCLDGPAYISSKQDSIYAIKTLWFCKQCRGKKSTSSSFSLLTC